MKIVRKIIEINEELCNGCGQCVVACAEGAMEIVAGKAKVIADKYCDGLGACIGECPTGALEIIERMAEDFDEHAVEALLAAKKKAEAGPPPMQCGCPSSQVREFKAAVPGPALRHLSQPAGPSDSALSHWPVQIRLVPPTAPFLKGADLLVAADCTAFAYPHFHRDLLAGKVVMVGCPKFDDREAYVGKFAEIFATAGLNSLTLAIMEVPCCGNLRGIISEAMRRAGATVPTEVVVIGARGHIAGREKLAA
ncbi:MAG: 4Fe-4S binding protein [Thermodesulfobacteriota bacterium]